MAEGDRLSVELEPPLADVVFLELALPLALGQGLLAEFKIVRFAVVGRRVAAGGLDLQILDLAAEGGFALLGFVFPLGQPQARGSQVRFELGHAGVELGFATIDIPQPLAEVAGKLGRLQLQLLAAGFDIVPQGGSEHLGRGFIDHLEHRLPQSDRIGGERAFGLACRFAAGDGVRSVDPRPPRDDLGGVGCPVPGPRLR